MIQTGEFDMFTTPVKVSKSILDNNVLPYVLILSKKQDNSYVIQSRYKANPEYKHYMYAGQWFLFAAIGLIFMLILMRNDK